jgi:hypothetical protein
VTQPIYTPEDGLAVLAAWRRRVREETQKLRDLPPSYGQGGHTTETTTAPAAEEHLPRSTMNATPTVNTPPFPHPNADGLAAFAAVRNEIHEKSAQLAELSLRTDNDGHVTPKEETR